MKYRKKYGAKKRTFRKGRKSIRKSGTITNWQGKIAQRKINCDYSVYFYVTNGTTGGNAYSFTNNGANQTWASLTFGNLAAGVNNGLAFEPSFLKEADQWSFFKINGVNLCYRSNVSDTAFSSIPSMAFTIVPGSLAVPNAANTWDSDNALRIQANNTDSAPVQKFYKMSGIFYSEGKFSNNGNTLTVPNPCCGDKLWISTYNYCNSTYDSSTGLQMYLGYLQNPQLITNATATVAYVMGTITATFYISLCCPTILTQL